MDGRFVLAAVVSQMATAQLYFTWPPKCWCCSEEQPEIHAKVSSAMPWITQVMGSMGEKLMCQR